MDYAEIFTTTYASNNCKHKAFTYKTVRLNFWIFDWVKCFKLCHECDELIKDGKDKIIMK